MKTPAPIDTSDLTQASRKLAERIDETYGARLQAGAKTFNTIRVVVAALASLATMAFLFGAWAISVAKKSDVSAQGESEAARHAELERRTSVLEAKRDADALTTAKALTDITSQLREQANVLLDIRIKLGASPPPADTVKHKR
jgi:hypothetical protein